MGWLDNTKNMLISDLSPSATDFGVIDQNHTAGKRPTKGKEYAMPILQDESIYYYVLFLVHTGNYLKFDFLEWDVHSKEVLMRKAEEFCFTNRLHNVVPDCVDFVTNSAIQQYHNIYESRTEEHFQMKISGGKLFTYTLQHFMNNSLFSRLQSFCDYYYHLENSCEFYIYENAIRQYHKMLQPQVCILYLIYWNP